ncbi:MAG: dienelactone hydrolase family protein [Rhodospirillaceae bacterium]|nr:dienelactone hydrolase family protein [Rhodospirillaceae bacterium]
MGKDITVSGKDGAFGGYLAMPSSGLFKSSGGPAVVVIQEIFGINKWIRGVCDMMAEEGYIALAPDLFWRIAPGVQLDPSVPEEKKQGFALYQKYDFEKAFQDIQSTIDYLRTAPGATGKVGNMGFCAGGFLSYLCAARSDTDASASYYGGGIASKLDLMGRIRKPTLLHLAAVDDFVPAEAQAQIKDAAATNPAVTVHVYPGVHHGFCRAIDASVYDAAACKLAHGRTLELFKKHLA